MTDLKAEQKANTNVVTLDQCRAAIKDMNTSAVNFVLAADMAARRAVEHASITRDTTAINEVYEALGTHGPRVGKVRQAAFMGWLFAHTPCVVKKTKLIGLYKKDSKYDKPFDMDAVNSTSFLDFVPKPKTAEYDNVKIANSIIRSLSKDYGDKWKEGAQGLDVKAILKMVSTAIQNGDTKVVIEGQGG